MPLLAAHLFQIVVEKVLGATLIFSWYNLIKNLILTHFMQDGIDQIQLQAQESVYTIHQEML